MIEDLKEWLEIVGGGIAVLVGFWVVAPLALILLAGASAFFGSFWYAVLLDTYGPFFGAAAFCGLFGLLCVLFPIVAFGSGDPQPEPKTLADSQHRSRTNTHPVYYWLACSFCVIALRSPIMIESLYFAGVPVGSSVAMWQAGYSIWNPFNSQWAATG